MKYNAVKEEHMAGLKWRNSSTKNGYTLSLMHVKARAIDGKLELRGTNGLGPAEFLAELAEALKGPTPERIAEMEAEKDAFVAAHSVEDEEGEEVS